jgi:hypothetical protein
MIVVINPSGSSGRSFKGLHAYCAHDPERAQTSERVDWIDMRNIAANDPEQAWKVMAATASSQNDLKRAAGVRAGRASKDGAVMHVVLSFDKDEPTDQETMQAAADDFLSHLGADPAKMRGKSKPSRRQFADEHQVVMYAHRDTEHAHLHLMINTVHPEHGIKLPTSNNQLKAQKWALEHSKRVGTDKNYPAREENADAREAGEYVKGERRKSRNVYEQEQAAQASNDNDRLKATIDAERKKDAALALRGRNMAELHAVARDQLVKAHRIRKAAIARELQRDIGQLKASIREEYRHKWRALKVHQAAELNTFEALESSTFGRASNMAKLSADAIREGGKGFIKRTFGVLSSAGERREQFERTQERARKALEREQASKLEEGTQALKTAQAGKYGSNRAVFTQERQKLDQKHEADRQQLKQDWRNRSAEKQATITKEIEMAETFSIERKAKPDPVDQFIERYRAQFDASASAKTTTLEQDNERDIDIADDD